MIQLSSTTDIDRLNHFLPALGEPARLVRQIPRIKFKKRIKRFQKEDLARAALHDGLILAWDTGLGKTWAMFLWPLLKCGYDRFGGMNPLKPVLLVIPEQLHSQVIEEAWKQFGIKIHRLDSQETYLRWTAGRTALLKPGWYITSYTQLCSNKVRVMPEIGDTETGPVLQLLMNLYNVTKKEVEDSPLKTQDGKPAPFDKKARHLLRRRYAEYVEGIGLEKRGFTCTYSPSLAELCRDEFECVVIDEGTRIKGDTTKIGTGVRLMNPKYRLVLTATPIKNRLPDLFWLAWWAAGGKEEAHARWPYSGIATEKEKFGEEFLVGERNLTHEKANNNGKPLPSKMRGNKWRKGKVTAEVCNIHRLWKLIGPVVLRRRKRDIGEDIVAKVRKPVYVPMGKAQARVYEYHLEAEYLDKNDDPALGAKLQALRSCAAAPHSPMLHYVEGSERKRFRSPTDYIPKVAAALEIIEKIIRSGEQVTVFSALHEPLDTLGRKLDEAGIPHDLLDGRTDCSLRGALSLAFQRGRPHAKAVMLAGANSMAEGNNWFRCSHAILIAYDWAYNIFEQAINRIHRLNSPKDVTVWPIICKGTIDRRLESLIDEKGDAAELVLDGALLEEASEEVSLRDLLQCAYKEFLKAETVDEAELEKEWPLLRSRLADAWTHSQFMGRVNSGIRPVPLKPLKIPFELVLNVPRFRVNGGWLV